MNSTYYSALGCDDNRYLLARLIQFFSPGTPQVYYAGLLAARNDMELLGRGRTSVGRNINRPYFDEQQVLANLERRVVRHLMNLARFRNTHPAFGGVFSVASNSGTSLRLGWRTKSASVEAWVDLREESFNVRLCDGGVERAISGWGEFSAVT